jgi:uncharacterized repeat protein (TIGR02543 family)
VSGVVGGLILDYTPSPVYAGYTLTGWTSDSEGAVPIGATDVITTATTVYAKWAAVTYDITYNLDGGTNGANPATYTVATSTITLAVATKASNTFGGWYTEVEYTNVVTTIDLGSSGDVELFAKFTVT